MIAVARRADDPLAAPGVALEAGRLVGLNALAWRSRRGSPQRRLSGVGPALARRVGRGLEAQEIRPWSFGDEVRHLDRNASARRGEPQVRLFRDEREARHLLVADFRPSMLWGTRRAFRSVAAAEALTLIGWRLAREGARLQAVALTADGPALGRGGVGEAGMAEVIAHLVRLHEIALRAPPRPEPPLQDLLAAMAPRLPRPRTLTIASAFDSPGSSLEAVLGALKEKGGLRLIRIRDAFEGAPAPGRYAYRAPGEPPRRTLLGREPPAAVDALAPLLERLGLRSLTLDAAAGPTAAAAALADLDHGRA